MHKDAAATDLETLYIADSVHADAAAHRVKRIFVTTTNKFRGLTIVCADCPIGQQC